MSIRSAAVVAAGLSLFLAAPSCTSSGSRGTSSGSAPGESCDDVPDPHCDNPVSRVLVPKLRKAKLAIRDAAPAEICRRMAVDLLGRTPTADELTACEAGTPTAVADAFLASPAHLATAKRGWAQRLHYDSYLMWYPHLLELDALAEQLHAGKLRYEAFAGRVVMHPAFYAKHSGDLWTDTLFTTFLGRHARSDELVGMRTLTQIWAARGLCDAAIWFNHYRNNLANGQDAVSAASSADNQCATGDGTTEHVADFCQCQPGGGSVGCWSDTLGTPIDFGTTPCVMPSDGGNVANFVAIGAASAGMHTGGCPDGSAIPGCVDRAVLTATTFGPIAPLPPADDAARAKIAQVGVALAARDDFWEAAVDGELRRLLGWWQSGFRRPDFDLPEVRAVLAAELKKTGSLTRVQRLIVTSLLYTQPATMDEAAPPAAPGGAAVAPPPWAFGPTKLLSAERWIDSASAAVGETVGACDYRAVTVLGYTADYLDPTLLTPVSSTLPDVLPSQSYVDADIQLGGCNVDAPPPTTPSIGFVSAQTRYATILCAAGRAAVPAALDPSDTSDGALAAIARHAVRQLLSRDATAAEITALTAEMKGCLAAGGNGCDDAEGAARWLCARLVDSAEFTLY